MYRFIFSLCAILCTSLTHANPPQLDPAKLMAVHLTNIAPKEGLMIPGLGGSKVQGLGGEVIVSGKDNLEMQAKLPWRRITLHWSIGAPIEGVDLPERRIDWSIRKYAVVEPLKHLLAESLGGLVDDWHTFGPHRLSDDALLFVPESESANDFGLKTVVYDASKQTVCEAVITFLKAQKVPVLKLDFATSAHLCITKHNLESIVDRVSSLPKDQEKSWIVKKLYDECQKNGPDHMKAFFKIQNEQGKYISLADPDLIYKQGILVNGEKVSVYDYFRPLASRYPNLMFSFTSGFVFSNIQKKLSEVFDRAVYFRAAQATPNSRETRGCPWHEQIQPEDKSKLATERKALAELNTLLEEASDELPSSCQKAGKLWVLGLKLWIRDVAKKRLAMLEKGTPFYSQSDDEISKHLNSVVYTVNKYSVQPLMAEYKSDLAKEYGFDFLSSKYPHLIKEADKPYVPKNSDSVSLDELKDVLRSSVYASKEQTMVPGEPDSKIHKLVHDGESEKLARTHPHHDFYKPFFDRRQGEMQCFEDILLSAEYLYQKVADQQTNKPLVIFPGRSGYLHQMAYEEVVKQMGDDGQDCVHVAFSGIVDAEGKREAQRGNGKEFHIENLVTSEKLEHYFKYLDKKGVRSYSDLYIVDLVSSGSGLNGFIKVLNAYFKSRRIEMPPLRLMALSAVISFDRAPNQSTLFQYRRKGDYSENEWVMDYVGNNIVNMNAYKIPTSIIFVTMRTHFNLIETYKFRGDFGLGMKYPAQAWTPRNDSKRDTRGESRAALEKYFRHNAARQIAWHMKKYGIKAVSEGADA